MKFFEFCQSNTGGSFDVDDKLAHRVLIEADTAEEAIAKAEELVMYWDGVENGKWATIKLTVVNSYTQYKYGKNHSDGVQRPLDYEALTLCMRKINETFKGKHIGLPKIGCGLAGGSWDMVKKIIQKELCDCDVTVVIYKP